MSPPFLKTHPNFTQNERPDYLPMKKTPLMMSVVAAALLALSRAPVFAEPTPGVLSLRFSEVEYLHRWAKEEQHEFTPRGQEDLEHWTDMVTINYYRDAKDGEKLAAMANAVLENYKNDRAKILRTDAVPRTPVKPAEYLLVAVLGRPDFLEAAFARFVLINGVGLSVVYCHREYGNAVGDQMSAWLQKNDPATEKALMGQTNIPLLDAAKM